MVLDRVEYFLHIFLTSTWINLSLMLKDIYAGCKIADKIINHLFYADDLVLFCPSYRGMQELLDTCVSYADKHDVKFNTNKSVVL